MSDASSKVAARAFISYAHADAENGTLGWVLERLQSWRALDHALHQWSDRDLSLGDRWEMEILNAIERARVGIVLVGPRFFESDFIRQREMPTLLLAARAGRLRIIPVVVYGRETNHLLQTQFRYPDARDGHYTATLAEFQGVDRALEDMTISERLQALSSVEGEMLRSLEESVPPRRQNESILAIGSGLVENNLLVDSQIELDYKHVVRRVRCFGGSGVNYTMRLSRMGCSVLPILSVGRDSQGAEIQAALAKEVPAGYPAIREFIQDDAFLCDRIRTSETYIVIHKQQRTTFTESVVGVERFTNHFYERLKKVSETAGIGAVMIGHLYVDHPSLKRERCLTADIASELNGNALVFANLGVSQIERGSRYWRQHLQNISVLQLTLQEAFHFFRDDTSVETLEGMLRWFIAAGATVIITHDTFGAVAVLRDEPDPFDAHRFPLLPENVVDKTGAGDAFGCGVMHSLLREVAIDRHNFMRALERGRVWGAYACTTVGGSHGSPTGAQLEEFEHRLKGHAEPVSSRKLSDRYFLERLRNIEEIERLRHPQIESDGISSRPSS